MTCFWVYFDLYIGRSRYDCAAPAQICIDTFGAASEMFDPAQCCLCLDDPDRAEYCPPACLQVPETCYGVLACEGVCAQLTDADREALRGYEAALCEEPCVIEMIDCVASQYLPRAERAELAELRAACGGPPAPALADGGRGGRAGRGGRSQPCSDGTMPVCADGSRNGRRGCADGNAAACADGPAPAPAPPVPQLELALAVDIATIAAGTPARLSFERTFKSDVARVASVQVRRIIVDAVSAGSIVVQFHIEQPFGLATRTATQASSADATAALQTALATRPVAIAGEVVDATALTVTMAVGVGGAAPPGRAASVVAGGGVVVDAAEDGDGFMLVVVVVVLVVLVLLVVGVACVCKKKRMKLGPAAASYGGDADITLGYVPHADTGSGTNSLAVSRTDDQMTFRNGNAP